MSTKVDISFWKNLKCWACLGISGCASTKHARSPTALFQPIHRLDHPDNYLFSLLKTIFTGWKYSNNLWFDFENKATGAPLNVIYIAGSEWIRDEMNDRFLMHTYSVFVVTDISARSPRKQFMTFSKQNHWIRSSGSLTAEISVRSSQKIFISII